MLCVLKERYGRPKSKGGVHRKGSDGSLWRARGGHPTNHAHPKEPHIRQMGAGSCPSQTKGRFQNASPKTKNIQGATCPDRVTTTSAQNQGKGQPVAGPICIRRRGPFGGRLSALPFKAGARCRGGAAASARQRRTILSHRRQVTPRHEGYRVEPQR